jgi:hypothetical protein
MAIPEAQLVTWSGRGAVTNSTASYNSVRTALLDSRSKIASRNPDVFLQGSYANATNIFGDSDVDVVVLTETVFFKDVSGLDANQRQLQVNAHSAATYGWADFRADVLQTLRAYYGNDRVSERDRCIKVDFGTGRIAADVIPAFQHKKYGYFYSGVLQSYTEGIEFRNRAGVPIVNFPKQHIPNGEAKNAAGRTNGWFKGTVRLFKNARNRLIRDRLIAGNICSSYFLECLVYNVPDNLFGGTYQGTFTKIVDYWAQTVHPDQCVCQNGITPLFGSSLVQWKIPEAAQLVQGLRTLWLNWA